MKDYKLFNEKMVKRLKRFYFLFFGLGFLFLLVIFLLSLMNNSFGNFITKHIFLICIFAFLCSYILSIVWTMIGKGPTKYLRITDSAFHLVTSKETLTYDFKGLILVEVDKNSSAPAILLSFVYNEENKVNVLIHNSFTEEIVNNLKEKNINVSI